MIVCLFVDVDEHYDPELLVTNLLTIYSVKGVYGCSIEVMFGSDFSTLEEIECHMEDK